MTPRHGNLLEYASAVIHRSIVTALIFLAYSNGANDNFKGVASLFGSRTCGYRTAISWATVATVAGSVTALFFAQALLKKFSGKDLVPDTLVASPQFVLAVALGAGATVILATLLGFPISTTHGLTGALVGAGSAASAGAVNFAAQTLPTLSVAVWRILRRAPNATLERCLELTQAVCSTRCIS